MIYAQIKDQYVANIIVLNDNSLESHFLVGFDHLIRIDTLSPIPQIGWLYSEDTQTFYNIGDYDIGVQTVEAELQLELSENDAEDAATIDINSTTAPAAVKSIWQSWLNKLGL